MSTPSHAFLMISTLPSTDFTSRINSSHGTHTPGGLLPGSSACPLGLPGASCGAFGVYAEDVLNTPCSSV
ncbi:MAG: hypothetical protein GXW96_01420 [Christensenellaceae bacterium]|nr:hypothetical protein [Christensenellaceae bacterium]